MKTQGLPTEAEVGTQLSTRDRLSTREIGQDGACCIHANTVSDCQSIVNKESFRMSRPTSEMGPSSRTVCLVYLVCLVSLVCLVYLVYLVCSVYLVSFV